MKIFPSKMQIAADFCTADYYYCTLLRIIADGRCRVDIVISDEVCIKPPTHRHSSLCPPSRPAAGKSICCSYNMHVFPGHMTSIPNPPPPTVDLILTWTVRPVVNAPFRTPVGWLVGWLAGSFVDDVIAPSHVPVRHPPVFLSLFLSFSFFFFFFLFRRHRTKFLRPR